MNRSHDRSKGVIIRILWILTGSGIYWIGYTGFLTHLESVWYSTGCLVLIVVGLVMAGWNSSRLFKRK